jgi:hypothetical protein
VGTGFGQLFRGVGTLSCVFSRVFLTFPPGQVGGVAVSAALFQSILNVELHKRIHGPDAEPASIVVIFHSRIKLY